MKWLDRIGKWYLIFWFSQTKIIEIGLGDNDSAETNEIYQVETKRFSFMYLSVAKPTLRYMAKDKEIIESRMV